MKTAEQWLASEFCQRTSPTTGNFTAYGIEAIQSDAQIGALFPESDHPDAATREAMGPEVAAERAEIAQAFRAKYGLEPEQIRQVVFDRKGVLSWQLCRSHVPDLIFVALALARLFSTKSERTGATIAFFGFTEEPPAGMIDELTAALAALQQVAAIVNKAPQ